MLGLSAFSMENMTPTDLELAEVSCDFCFPCAGGQASFLETINTRDHMIKESLFLTQEMRQPSPAHINVIERRPVGDATGSHAVSVAQEARRLRAQFESELASLK